MWDADPVGTFSHAARALDGLGLAFLHVVEGAVRADATSGGTASATDLLRCVYSGTLVSTGGYTPESGEAAVASGRADLIGFGRLFIANPDLPERIRRGSELNAPDRATFYSGGVRGYTDYPLLEHAELEGCHP
jgi:N-ethylmaleimide reductase